MIAELIPVIGPRATFFLCYLKEHGYIQQGPLHSIENKTNSPTRKKIVSIYVHETIDYFPF